MPKTSDASSFTRYQKLNAQSITTTKNATQSSAPSVALTMSGSVAATLKASAVAASVAPSTSIVALSNLKGNTKKRG